MSGKMRSVYSKIWEDDWFSSDLNPLDRYLFLYFLTNSASTICGIYEIPLKRVATDTGLEVSSLERVHLPRLDTKILYHKGWVCVVNWEKYHKEGSPKLKMGIDLAKKAVPSHIMSFFDDKIKGIHTLSPSAIASAIASASIPATKVAEEEQQEPPRVKEPRTPYKTKTEPSEVSRFIEMFSAVNLMYKTLYRNTTQRRAIDDLLNVMSPAELENVIKSLPAVNAKVYTKITTPCQLVQNLAKVKLQLNTVYQKEKKELREFA